MDSQFERDIRIVLGEQGALAFDQLRRGDDGHVAGRKAQIDAYVAEDVFIRLEHRMARAVGGKA